MKCVCCNSDDLFGKVTLSIGLEITKRGGSVKVGGSKISQLDMKDAWNKGNGCVPATIRGPILCADCGTEMFYVVGAPSNPYEGSHIDADVVGGDHFVNGGTLGAE